MTDISILPPPPPHSNISVDFSFLSASDAVMIKSGYEIVQKSEAWGLLKSFNGESFMFPKDPAILSLMNKVNSEYPGHSGSSLGYTMRHLEFIAKHGFYTYRSQFLS